MTHTPLLAETYLDGLTDNLYPNVFTSSLWYSESDRWISSKGIFDRVAGLESAESMHSRYNAILIRSVVRAEDQAVIDGLYNVLIGQLDELEFDDDWLRFSYVFVKERKSRAVARLITARYIALDYYTQEGRSNMVIKWLVREGDLLARDYSVDWLNKNIAKYTGNRADLDFYELYLPRLEGVHGHLVITRSTVLGRVGDIIEGNLSWAYSVIGDNVELIEYIGKIAYWSLVLNLNGVYERIIRDENICSRMMVAIIGRDTAFPDTFVELLLAMSLKAKDDYSLAFIRNAMRGMEESVERSASGAKSMVSWSDFKWQLCHEVLRLRKAQDMHLSE